MSAFSGESLSFGAACDARLSARLTGVIFPFFLFFRIMMVSVLRHTRTPVKFWFLKNYLSPSFKVCVLCHLALDLIIKAALFTLSVVRRPSLTWQRSTASSMSWCSISGHVGSTSKRRNSGSFGVIRSSSWTSCFPWPWIRSYLWTQTRWGSKTELYCWERDFKRTEIIFLVAIFNLKHFNFR